MERSRAFALTLAGRYRPTLSKLERPFQLLPTAKHVPGQTCADSRESNEMAKEAQRS